MQEFSKHSEGEKQRCVTYLITNTPRLQNMCLKVWCNQLPERESIMELEYLRGLVSKRWQWLIIIDCLLAIHRSMSFYALFHKMLFPCIKKSNCSWKWNGNKHAMRSSLGESVEEFKFGKWFWDQGFVVLPQIVNTGGEWVDDFSWS